MLHMIAGVTAPPRWQWSSASGILRERSRAIDRRIPTRLASRRRAASGYDAAMDRRQGLALFRAIVAIAVLAAIAYQAKVIIDTGLFRPLRFFAFFTILSNLFGAILWLWLAARWRRRRTRVDDLLRGAATLYLVVTFVVVVLLL